MLCAVLWCAVHPENQFMHRSHFLAKPSNCKEDLPPWQKSIDGFSKKKPYCPIGKESDRTDWPEIIWICPWDVGAPRVSISTRWQLANIKDFWCLTPALCLMLVTLCILRDSVQWLTYQLLKKYSLKTVFLSEVLSFFQTGKRDYHCCFLVEGGLAKHQTFYLTFFKTFPKYLPIVILLSKQGKRRNVPTQISPSCALIRWNLFNTIVLFGL